MINDFFTETATVKKLGAATKVKRTLEVGSTIQVSKPQPKTELDLVAGVYITKHNVYCKIDEDIRQGDFLVIDSKTYQILETYNHREGNLQFKRLITGQS